MVLLGLGLAILPSTGFAQYFDYYPYQTPDVVTYPNSDYGNVIYQPRGMIAPPAPVTQYYPVHPYSLPRQYPPPRNHYIGFGFENNYYGGWQNSMAESMNYQYPSFPQTNTWYSQAGL